MYRDFNWAASDAADNCEYCVEILSINTEAADYVLDWIRLDIEYIVSYIE